MLSTRTSTTPGSLDERSAALADTLVAWLETGVRPEHLFSPAVVGDLSLPQWRLQTRGPEELFAIREQGGHNGDGTVRVEGLDPTPRGFVLRFDERWPASGQQWYAREVVHAVIEDDLITEFAVYCTGDWDEATQRRHAAL
jgi:hypothetical protein